MNINMNKKIIFSLIFFVALYLTTSAKAFVIPPPAWGPDLGPDADATMAIEYATSKVTNTITTATGKIYYGQKQLTKALNDAYPEEVTLMYSKAEQKSKETAIEGSKKIAKCKIADIEKPSSVKEAIYKLFLTYPSATDATANTEYRKKADEFYQDTVIETYVAAREMEKELDALEVKFADLSPSLVTGENTSHGTQAGDDNNGTWKNAYTAYDIMNELLKITEELAAMRAQLDAAYAIKEYVSPAMPKSKKSSCLDKRDNMQLASNASYKNSEVLAFAQIDFNNFQKVTVSNQPTISSNGGASIEAFAKAKQEKAVNASRQEAIGLFSTQIKQSATTQTPTTSEDEDEADEEFEIPEKSFVSFVTAPKPDLGTPFDGSEEKMAELNKLDPLYEQATKALEVHNLLQSLPTYKENAEKYNRFKQLHEKSLEMLKASDQCVLGFLGRYYSSPEKIWSGGPISDENIANYDLRSGLSGWAIKAFEIAKAETTAPLDSEDGIITEIELFDTSDMSNRKENEEKYKEKNQDLTNPSDMEKASAINRETEMIAWKIGAEASKKLAEDQYSKNPQWGTPKVRFPIWNDQKNFYNQYIDGKYNNIKEYLAALQFNKTALEIAKELNNILTEDADVKAYNAKELSKLASALPEDEEVEENTAENELTSGQDQKQTARAQAEAEHAAAIKALQTQKDSINKNLDEAIEKLNSFNERINQLKQEQLSAQSSIEDYEIQLEQATDIANYGEAEEGETLAQTVAKESIKESQEKEASAEAEIKRYQSLSQTQEEKVKSLKEQLSQIEEKIKAADAAYAAQVKKIEVSHLAQKLLSRKKLEDNKVAKAAQTVLSIYQNKVEKTVVGDLIGTASVKGLISKAEGLIGDTKNYAVEEVEKARADIYKLGDELYLPGSSAMVVKRHAELMKKLQNISMEELMNVSSSVKEFGSNTAISQALTTLFQKTVTQKACADGRCDTADSEYFLGITPKDKDFAAPKAAPEMYMPPAREIVFFDGTSYENVPQTADGVVTREGFLNYGEEIPAIWQTMLKEDVFVEQGADLNAILEAGSGREANFMRGGRYPCKLDGKIIDIDPYEGQYMVVNGLSDGSGGSNEEKNSLTQEFLKKIGVYIEEKLNKNTDANNTLNESNLPQCQEIELVGNKGIAAKFFYTVRDIEADTAGPAAVQPQESLGNPSELGTLLKAEEEGGLRFADKPQEVFDRLKSMDENASTSEETERNLKDELYMNTMYSTNQIGDFLNFVEVETTYRLSMEELKADLDEGTAMLKEQLTSAGYAPSADFDISNSEDYELARDNLDRYKNELVESGFSGISGVDVTDNEVVEERLNKIKRIFTALRKDKDELLSLNENSPSDSELDEQIKSEEVNKSVVGEYDKQVEEEFKKQLNNFKRPFCAAY